MKPDLPNKIKVGALLYDLILVADRNLEDGKGNTATCNIAFQKIWLEYGNRKIEGLLDDIVHEVIEAINTQCNLDLDHKSISTLGTMFLQFLRDNNIDFRQNSEERFS